MSETEQAFVITARPYARNRDIEVCEAELNEARLLVDYGRSQLRALARRLAEADESVRSARSKMMAARLSYASTLACAKRNGLEGREPTDTALRRIRAREELARSELHGLISGAAPLCDEFNIACAELRAARALEHDCLEQLLLAHARVPDDLSSRAVAEVREAIADAEAAARQEPAPREELVARAARERVSAARRLPDDAHYDPDYDDYELALRRSRPWV